MHDQMYDFLVNIILVGESCTGKSSWLQYNNRSFSDQYTSTIGIDFQVKITQCSKKIFRLHIWDTSGDQRFIAITQAYFRGGHGFFILFSLIDRNSFERVSHWKNLIDKGTTRKLPIILIGNKSDLENERVVSYNEGKELADRLGIIYIEMSLKHEFNVERALKLLMLSIMPTLLGHYRVV